MASMKIFCIEDQLINGIKQILSTEDKYSHTYHTMKNEVTLHVTANLDNVRKELLNWLQQPGRIKDV